MSNLNKSLISDLQTKTLQEKIEDAVDVVDLYWLGYDCNSSMDPSLFVRRRVQAHINRVLLWFSSKPNDYVRETLKGGILYNLLGSILSDDNIESKEDLIKARFSSEFANDLDLVYLKIEKDVIKRGIKIKMVVKDVLLNTIIPITAEVTA